MLSPPATVLTAAAVTRAVGLAVGFDRTGATL
jgi:hypothetical protein